MNRSCDCEYTLVSITPAAVFWTLKLEQSQACARSMLMSRLLSFLGSKSIDEHQAELINETAVILGALSNGT